MRRCFCLIAAVFIPLAGGGMAFAQEKQHKEPVRTEYPLLFESLARLARGVQISPPEAKSVRLHVTPLNARFTLHF